MIAMTSSGRRFLGLARYLLQGRSGEEAERLLELAQALFDPGAVLPPLPRDPGLRVDAVHHEVDVLVGAVLMGHEQRLMLGEPQVREHPVSDGLHPLPRDRV